MSTTANVCGLCGVYFPPGTLHHCVVSAQPEVVALRAERDALKEHVSDAEGRCSRQSSTIDILRGERDALKERLEAVAIQMYEEWVREAHAERDEAVRLLRDWFISRPGDDVAYRTGIFLARLDGEA